MKSLCIKINMVLILFLVLSFSGTAFALRCGTKLIDIGDSKERILEYCGPPSQVVVTGRGYSTQLLLWRFSQRVQALCGRGVDL